MADIMGSSGLAWYQWKKHGRCTGLSSADYFALTRKAAALIAIPATLRNLPRDVSLPAKVVEDAFIEANRTVARRRHRDLPRPCPTKRSTLPDPQPATPPLRARYTARLQRQFPDTGAALMAAAGASGGDI
ncbi:MAG: hypothetical protein U1E41_14510 [Paracoccus sp. (in: a-proteobacteria)]